MKALITRGKNKGREVEISQWCNDWFSINTGDPMIDRLPFSPSSLAFTREDMETIRTHKNNGILFNLFGIRERSFKIVGDENPDYEKYVLTFVRRI